MKKHTILPLLLAAMLLTGCGAWGHDAPITAKQEAAIIQPEFQFQSNHLNFMSKLMQKVNNENSNTCISAYSIEQAFGMLANGTGGSARTEIEDVFGSNTLSMNEYLKKWRENQPNEEGCLVKTANAFFMNSDLNKALTFSDSFKNAVASVYGGEISSYSFEKENTAPINEWSNKHTDGLIPKLLDEFDMSDPEHIPCAVLTNAALFEAKWERTWGKEPYCCFTDADGTKHEDMDFMCDESLERYYVYDGNEAFMRPYQNNQYMFVGIKPKKSANDFIKNMTAESIQKLLSTDSIKNIETHVYMPAFSYDTELKRMSNILQEMGIKTVFGKGEHSPDFSNMASYIESNHHIEVSDVIHKTHIEVDKEGTKAAAVSAIEMDFVSDSVSVGKVTDYHVIEFDEPFVFMIYDTKMQLPLFIGTVNAVE